MGSLSAKKAQRQVALEATNAYTSARENAGISSGSSVTTSDTAPSNPSNGDQWFDTSSGALYVYYTDVDGSQWVGVSGPAGPQGASGEAGPAGTDGAAVVYANIADLPLTGNTTGEQAFVSENNRLYIWNGTGWYNIALINTTPTAITGANGSYQFASDGTPIVLTLVSTDPEGLPITWSYAVTSGSLENGGGTTATISQAANVFTITPTTTEDYAGDFSLTFTASDGVNLAIATSSFALMFAILNSKYTTLMLKTSGTNAQQNNTFVDSSTNNFAITRNGNVAQGTFSPYGDKWSNYFAAGTDKLEIADDTNLGVFNGDYTIECWAYSEVSQTTSSGIVGKGGSSTGWTINVTGTTLLVTYAGTTGLLTSGSGLFTVGEWHHVAVCRTGSTITLFCDGVIIDTATRSTNDNTTSPVRIGTNRIDSAKFQGYISNLRIVGSALYTSNFTPPTEPLTAIAGTSLLTCQSNRLVDNSTNNFAITKSGDVKVQRFSPYDIESYNPSVIGGSSYHSGTDYLSYTEQAIGTSTDFCWELFIYPTGNAGGQTRLYGASTNDPLVYVYGAAVNGSFTNWYIYFADSLIMSGTLSIPMYSWNHIAVTRSSGTLRFFLNGVLLNSIANSSSFSSKTWWVGSHPTSNSGLIGYISDYRTNIGSAIYTSNFTPPTAPLTAIANTSLLLNSTDAGIYDSSGNNDIETVGNAQVSTAVTKYGSSSMYFDGSGDYLKIPASTNFGFGTGNWTIECWIYITNMSHYNTIFDTRVGTGTQTGSFSIGIFSGNGTGTLQLFSGGAFYNPSNTFSENSWYHIAVVKNNGVTKLYVNGTGATTSYTDSRNYGSSQPVQIGNDDANNYFQGYISDLRITKGLARYTANFTPPTSELLG